MGRYLAPLVASACLLAPCGFGQSSTAQDFVPQDFARFSPQTARDMVAEIPGFSVESGDSQRGLGQAGSNILINGERITSKSIDANDALSRIPAARVVRLELRDAATLGIPGLSGLVVNVVTESGDLSGVYSYSIRVRERLEPRLNTGEFSLSGQWGEVDWTAGLDASGNRFGNAGPEFVTGPDDTLREERREDLQGNEEHVEGSLALAWSGEEGRAANLNLSYGAFNLARRLQGIRTPSEGDPSFRLFRRGEDEWNSEIGGDYTFPLAGGSLKLIGLYRHEDSRFNSRIVARDASSGTLVDGRLSLEDYVENEAIARAEFDLSRSEGRSWQLAGELAFNRLDAGADFILINPDLSETLADRAIPTLVEETRSELSLTHTRQLSPRLALQASLSGEYSEISSQVGADGQAREFFRPKGYVSLGYETSNGASLEVRAERRAGQLDFFDFVASQDLINGNDTAGNREIVPAQAWRLEASYARDFGNWAAVELGLFHEEIEDRIDNVPLGNGEEGPGNLDSASQSGLEISTTLRFDRFGAEGLQLTANGEARTSELEDPLTGRARAISGDRVSNWFAELRWDVPQTPYTVLLAGEGFRNQRQFRLRETSVYRQTDPFLWVEARHKDVFGQTVFVRVGNLLDHRDAETRVVYTPDRTGEISEIRAFERDFGYILTIGISGTF